MAKAVEIYDVQTLPSGRIAVQLAYGTPPLGTVATTEFQYADADQLKQRIADIELMVGEEGLTLLHLAITYLSQSGSFNNLNSVRGKTLTLDPFAASPLKVT